MLAPARRPPTRLREAAGVKLVCYLGTRGCPGVLEEALRDDFDPVAIAVPREPRLLGPHRDEVDAALERVAELLADRARARAIERARQAEEQLADVFGRSRDPSDRIDAFVLDPPVEETVPAAAERREAEACLLARDALDVLDGAGVPLVDALDTHRVPLVTR
jgi:hypothetical protein